jgi:lipoprotein-anchoring transpeptidase ErfK/SrfK
MSRQGEKGQEHRETEARPGRGCLPKVFVGGLLILLLGVGGFSAWTVERAVLAPYETRVYPNVSVLEENLGGLTPEEAAERLEMVFPSRNAGDLILSDGQEIWRVPWPAAGMHLDADATAKEAFAARRGAGWRTVVAMWLGEEWEISPVFTIDAEATRRALEQLAPEMYQPPTDATLQLEGDRVVTTASRPGRELDVDATVEKVVNTVRHLGPDYPFAPTYRIVTPHIADVRGVEALAEEMLSREIEVTAEGEHEGQPFSWNWTLGRRSIFSWLRVEETEEKPGYTVQIDEGAVRETVARLAAEPEANEWGFPTEETTEQVLKAFRAGGGKVAVELTPPPRIYIVEAGDRLTTIAAKFGMPPGLIAEVNRGTDLDHLTVGQELIIPPQDVLCPYETVPSKSVVISIPEQRLRVYEDGQLLHDWPCSTGMKDSPTYTGEFQILSKEEMAFASQWDLEMPHFLGVYRAGGDTYNGIHALPILANGQRLWGGHLGSPASYGCIILGIEEAATLFEWAELGVPVVIE